MSSTTTAPDKELLDYIQAQWTQTTEGILKENVMFTDRDENTENATYAPHVIVQPAGARRLQPEEDVLHEFTFTIKVRLWNRWSKIPKATDKKYLHWLMVDHIKKMFSIAQHKCPSGWQWAYISETANTALAFDLLVDLNEFILTIKAVLPWSDAAVES
jgi:hypothetical protein